MRTTNRDGRHGAYYLATSDGASRLIPLLVALHGTGGDGASMVATFRELADRESFAIVAPDSGKAPDGQWSWEVGNHPGEVTDDYRHVMRCVREFMEIEGGRIDHQRILIVGHSGGGSAAPYIASNESFFSAFATVHGGVIPGGIGGHRVRGWFSTGDVDAIRPPVLVRQSFDYLTKIEHFSDVQFRVYRGSHSLIPAELSELVEWWLHG